MVKIKFDVSSKTARLIGRENISDYNGAVIELVKNAYDADASNVYIEFDIKFASVPEVISYQDIKKIFSQAELNFILKCYTLKDDQLLKNSITIDLESKLKEMFFKKNRIVIFDNGLGMNENVIKNVWMNIGTNDKEINEYSRKGRLKTGAKGIGRFALEKLSLKTTVYSKKTDFPMIFWSIDWKQFDHIESLNNINADFLVLSESFEDKISKYIDISYLKTHGFGKDFFNGTLIVLDGTTDNWTEKIFDRINRNLKSINPFGSSDKFDICINNKYFPKYNFVTSESSLSADDYDYKIKAQYDGDEKVTITLCRNEVDLHAKYHISLIEKKEYKFDLDSFWQRDAFRKFPYRKEDYAGDITHVYTVSDLLGNIPKEEIKKIGKFDFEVFFLKSGNSDYGFVKDIKVNTRKKLLRNFSGVKIYRDNFKVRPYGEDGPMYDWLALGARAQKSPAGVTHSTGSWRVFTYQLIGFVHISRKDNPLLADMANREGLALNETYYLFVDLIHSIISKFEYDRQYIYREFGLWLKDKEEPIRKSSFIEQDVLNEKENGESQKSFYSEEEYREAIYDTSKEKQKSIETQKILMNFSSVGVTANTFAHEISRVATNLSSRGYQLRGLVKNLLNNEDFDGPDYYNPFFEIDANEKCDILLSKWLKLIMESASKESKEKQTINIIDFFRELKNDWIGLLKEKKIDINFPYEGRFLVEIEKIDLFLIFNNIILNSSYYLENCNKSTNRKIDISMTNENKYIRILVSNNGPKLDSKYTNTPDLIFEPGETSKDAGTGLGLWICRDTVNRNYGEIHVVKVDSGFTLEIKLPEV